MPAIFIVIVVVKHRTRLQLKSGSNNENTYKLASIETSKDDCSETKIECYRQSSPESIKDESKKPVTTSIIVEMEEDYLKIKERPPPGLNASQVLWYAMMFTMFSIGCVTLNSCPLNRMIPIYLIVTGLLGASAKLLSKLEYIWTFNISLGLVVAYIVWSLLGSYWIFREYQPSYTSMDSPRYCIRVAYLFSFWWLILQYTLCIAFVLLGLCYMLMRNDFTII